MMVFWRERLVFLATTKTASTSIEAALGSKAALLIKSPPAIKHVGPQKFHRFLAPYLGEKPDQPFELVALMREPVDWLGSWYRYRQRPGVRAESSTAHLSFDGFIEAHCQENPPECAAVGKQADYLMPRQGRQVDHVFRYEEIDYFVAFMEARLNMAINLPRRNVSPAGSIALSPANLALLETHCARDFALYHGLNRPTV